MKTQASPLSKPHVSFSELKPRRADLIDDKSFINYEDASFPAIDIRPRGPKQTVKVRKWLSVLLI